MTADIEATRRGNAPSSGLAHGDVLAMLSGLLLAMFAATLSGTVVTTALPGIVEQLDGDQSQYTWVVTAYLLAATATTPVWGRLADRTSKKQLAQASTAIFVIGSGLCGFAQTAEALIGFRVLQGIGGGGVITLGQIVMASVVSPRERGRYSGYFTAVIAVATAAGPLLGGLVVDTPALGWRWCFWLGVPLGAAALVLVHVTLRTASVKADLPIDWLGAALIPGGIAVLLIWLTLVSEDIPVISPSSATLVGAGLALAILAVIVERRSPDPVVPPHVLRRRTMALAIAASVPVGIAAMAVPVFAPQYFQIARGYAPTPSGLMIVPMMVGLLAAVTLSGYAVARTGRWKRHTIAGAALIVAGLSALGTIDRSTPLALVGIAMAVVGIGLGATMQNLVVAAQNSLEDQDIGAGTSAVTFFRALGGAAGIAALGALYAGLVSRDLAAIPGLGSSSDGRSTLPDLSALPPPARSMAEDAYASASASVFLLTAALAGITLLMVLLMPDTRLREAAPER